MGGFAVAINWDAPTDSRAFGAMCRLMSHRATAGLRTAHGKGSSLAEARLPRDGSDGWQLATLGPLTIVGDVRLWNTARLAAMAGTTSDNTQIDDRQLLLSAFHRHGLAMMDAVDGDFAFVIWNEAERIVVAARDRFGVKPIFVERTDTGIRFASEPKQIVAYTGTPPTPSIDAAAQHLSGRFFLDHGSSFTGIDRLLPAHTLVASKHAHDEHRYWNLQPTETRGLTADNVHVAMREHLTDAVARRLAGSQRAVLHLSGGLDSASITASAALLASDGLDPDRIHTVSAIFPGRDEDESRWISDVANGQEFAHTEFEPRNESIDVFSRDMRTVGTPVASVLRDITVRAGEIGRDTGSDLLLTGNGGDEVAGDRWLLSDILRTGGWEPWRRGVSTVRRESLFFAMDRAVASLRLSAPDRVKAPVRAVRRIRQPDLPGFLTPLLAESLAHQIEENPPPAIRSGTDAMAQSMPNAVLLRVLEAQEAQLAEFGMDISHPFLDRTLVEFVAGIDPTLHPIMLRDKSLLRTAYRGVLPDSLLDRRGKTHTNALIVSAHEHYAPEFRHRFETVPPSAETFIDAGSYLSTTQSTVSGEKSGTERGNLWKAWSFLLWLDALKADNTSKVPTEDEPPYS